MRREETASAVTGQHRDVTYWILTVLRFHCRFDECRDVFVIETPGADGVALGRSAGRKPRILVVAHLPRSIRGQEN